jgi:hypothetical protein
MSDGPRRVRLGGGDRAIDRVDVGVAGLDAQDLPAHRRVARADVLGHRQRGRAVEGDAVVVPQADQLAQPEVAGQAGRLLGHTLDDVAVADERVGVVVDDGVPGAVPELGGEPLGDRHADRVGVALPQRPGGRLDAGGQVELRVTGRARPPTAGRPSDRRGTDRSRRRAGARTGASSRGRPTGRSDRGRASSARSDRPAGGAATRRRPSARRPSAGRGGRCWRAGSRRSTACGGCSRRASRGRSSRPRTLPQGRHRRHRGEPDPLCSRRMLVRTRAWSAAVAAVATAASCGGGKRPAPPAPPASPDAAVAVEPPAPPPRRDNRTPELFDPGWKTVGVGQTVAFSVAAIDQDLDDVRVDVTAMPRSARFDALTQTVVWTPTKAELGTATFTLAVDELTGPAADAPPTSINWSFTVAAKPQPVPTAPWGRRRERTPVHDPRAGAPGRHRQGLPVRRPADLERGVYARAPVARGAGQAPGHRSGAVLPDVPEEPGRDPRQPAPRSALRRLRHRLRRTRSLAARRGAAADRQEVPRAALGLPRPPKLPSRCSRCSGSARSRIAPTCRPRPRPRTTRSSPRRSGATS